MTRPKSRTQGIFHPLSLSSRISSKIKTHCLHELQKEKDISKPQGACQRRPFALDAVAERR